MVDRGVTAKERIMIHLRDFHQYEKEVECPHAMTQDGISEATGLILSHIPRNLKQLKEEGLVDEGKAYIYFFPGGLAEHAIVQLSDGDDRVYSVETHPISGRAVIYNFPVDPEEELDELQEAEE